MHALQCLLEMAHIGQQDGGVRHDLHEDGVGRAQQPRAVVHRLAQ
jgi:hypothetical protein